MLDGAKQAVGGAYPLAQFVVLVAPEHRQLVFAGALRINATQMMNQAFQRTGHQPLVNQMQQESQAQRAQDAAEQHE